MFINNFVATIKYNNSFLRESGNTVNIPFGVEYSIFLKNLDSRKSVVKVSIDGKDVLDGSSIIIFPNKPLELNGFMKDDKIKNKFKFIQKTKEVSEYRGDRIDDGIIRIEYTFEKKVNSIKVDYDNNYHYHIYHPPFYITSTPTPAPFTKYEWYCGDFSNGSICNDGIVGSHSCSIHNDSQKNDGISVRNCSNENSVGSEGITVKGSEVNEVFDTGYTNELEETSNVITLMLRGIKEDGSNIVSPVLTKTKLTCPTCGKNSKSNCKYCYNCGTYLL